MTVGDHKDEDKKTPGRGWTNGDLPPSLFPYSREGKIGLYGKERRWINAQSSWTRIGQGSELDAIHSQSASGTSTIRSLADEARTIRSLVAQLCERFYYMEWATGTGGGVSIRTGGPSEYRPWRIFVAPSGVQKEDMIGDDVFELDMEQNVVEAPKTPNLRRSACTPLWFVIYRHRPTARCVIHTHSLNAQLATLLDVTETSPVVRITHLEMLKGCGNHAYDDILEVPVIDNRPTEDLLADQLEEAVKKYPKANAVLVRRHGIYAWGDSWEQAKTQCESFDYLFESAIKMRSMGIDCSIKPVFGTYRDFGGGSSTTATDFNEHNKRSRDGDGLGEQNERVKEFMVANGTGFNAASKTDNAVDLNVTSTSIPLLPRDAKILLLDIEGCTTSISSVKDILFPFILDHVDEEVLNMDDGRLLRTHQALCADVEKLDNEEIRNIIFSELPGLAVDVMSPSVMREAVKAHVRIMVNHDVKATGLKKLQGEMWESGFKSGKLQGHVYPDFKHAMEWCKLNGVSVFIYSSGSIDAQKLLFGYSVEGDVTPYLSGYFDTTTGPKKETSSYRKIANALGEQPSNIVFVSDAEDELVAARDAGVCSSVMSVRSGNAPLTDVSRSFPIVYSLLQLCGAA